MLLPPTYPQPPPPGAAAERQLYIMVPADHRPLVQVIAGVRHARQRYAGMMRDWYAASEAWTCGWGHCTGLQGSLRLRCYAFTEHAVVPGSCPLLSSAHSVTRGLPATGGPLAVPHERYQMQHGVAMARWLVTADRCCVPDVLGALQ